VERPQPGAKIELAPVKLPRKYRGKIAFSAGGRIHTLDLETGERLAYGGMAAMQFPDWHPNGASFATSNGTIYHQDIVTEQLKTVAADFPAGFDDPSWNNEGTILVFRRNIGRPSGMYIADVLNDTYEHTGVDYASGCDWSPDGKRIVFYGMGKEHSGLYLMDVASKSIHRLPSEEGKIHFHPHWHPDNRHITFVTNRHSRKFDIYAMNVETGQTQELLRASEWGGSNFPQWSPDGEYIVFTHTYGRGVKYPTTLHIMRADGSDIVDLGIKGAHPTWWMNLA
jgi:Tol biopolymer transport system component